MKLCNMTERVKVFTTLFKTKRPFFEERYIKKKEEVKLVQLNPKLQLQVQSSGGKNDGASESQSRLSSRSKRSKLSRSPSFQKSSSRRGSKTKSINMKKRRSVNRLHKQPLPANQQIDNF